MSKPTICGECGHSAEIWFPRCPKCHSWKKATAQIDDAELSKTVAKSAWASMQPRAETSWGSVPPHNAPPPVQMAPPIGTTRPRFGQVTGPLDLRAPDEPHPDPIRITNAETTLPKRTSTGFSSFDRVLGKDDDVLGAGFVEGSAILLGGDPGIGKSTLLAQALAQIARLSGRPVLYATGEESIAQATLRARRVGATDDNVWIVPETDVDRILEHARKLRPIVLAIDSIQTVGSEEISGARGSLAQVRGCCGKSTAFAKITGCTVILIGHVTKGGDIAGPKTLEHLVDVTLQLELGEYEQGRFRYLKAWKNRFGSTAEVGAFEMVAKGMLDTEEETARDDDRQNVERAEIETGHGPAADLQRALAFLREHIPGHDATFLAADRIVNGEPDDDEPDTFIETVSEQEYDRIGAGLGPVLDDKQPTEPEILQ